MKKDNMAMKNNGYALTATVKCAGCAAKVGSGVLRQIMGDIPPMDDAGVYRLRDDLAIIQTVDFFPPIVNHPYHFGCIAAANALSDVYAMGGTPITAMNIVGFPVKKLGIDILKEILKGGADKLMEAGAALAGGHSIDDEELKYGLSVTGTVHPDRIIRNSTALPGDSIILTKPLGSGIMVTGIKGGVVPEADETAVISSMELLNRTASESMLRVGVSACTDVTGFGLIGHAYEMASGSAVAMRILSSQLPKFDIALELASEGILPEGMYKNREFFDQFVRFADGVSDEFKDVVFDPQTSGGLLISVPESKSRDLLEELHSRGLEHSSIIGDIIPAGSGSSPVIIVEP